MSREINLTDRLIRYINKNPHAYAEKTHGGSFGISGKADITACYKGLRIEIEVKREDGTNKPSELQRYERKLWAKAGAVCFFVDDYESGINALEHVYLQVDIAERNGLWKLITSDIGQNLGTIN